MYSANAESEVSTLHLGYDDIDAVLAKAIADDCLRAGERSSYRTRANKIFLHEDLIRDEPCIVVPRHLLEADSVGDCGTKHVRHSGVD
jgi:hypothetical protein